MKKITLLTLFTLLLGQVLSAQEKTVIGLTPEEIVKLQENNPGLTIQLDKTDSDNLPYFSGLKQAQAYVDSIKQVMAAAINVPEQSIPVNRSAQDKFAPCGCGDYNVNVGSAGLFSSFNFSFNYCNGTVSNAHLNVTGLQIGWSWGATTSSYNGLYGCSYATATFGYGILSWNQIVRISWHFNPNSCTFFYQMGGGPCGIRLDH